MGLEWLEPFDSQLGPASTVGDIAHRMVTPLRHVPRDAIRPEPLSRISLAKPVSCSRIDDERDLSSLALQFFSEAPARVQR